MPVPAPTWIVPEVPAVDRDTSMRDVVRAGLLDGLRLLADHDRVIRRDDDPEGIHQARVGLRRMRSVLRLCAPVLDESWRTGLDGDLRELAQRFGPVRDNDVLAARLRDRVAALPTADDRVAGVVLLDALAVQRSMLMREVIVELDGDRYLELVPRLVGLANQPRFTSTSAGERLARRALPRLVRRPYRRLEREVGGLTEAPSAGELHRLRIRAKRARYAADLAVPVIGLPARKLGRRLATLTDVLGDVHDLAVAEAWLRDAAHRLGRHDGPDGATAAGPSPTAGGASTPELVAGMLIVLGRQEREALLEAWRPAWRRARRPAATSWLDH